MQNTRGLGNKSAASSDSLVRIPTKQNYSQTVSQRHGDSCPADLDGIRRLYRGAHGALAKLPSNLRG